MPMGIAYYEAYNTLSVFAPELRGKWSFHPIPGTERVDEHGNVYIDILLLHWFRCCYVKTTSRKI